MRNLKKILALVLALVMSLSLMATAGASNFTDASSINDKYETAVEVLEGLGVFKGYQEGSSYNFKPDGEITRGEVAAIIYRIATGDVKDENVSIYADYNKFTDVPNTLWSAGYINFCANAEYIKGEGNGKFNPEGKVTGYQALAMILRAIGYTANGGFTGTGWDLQTAAAAEAKHITDNIQAGTLGMNATRQTIAEILFRAILVDMVNYDQRTGYYDLGQSLGYKIFKLEELEGVVVANEYANLYGNSVLADGKTNLQVAGEDKVRTLSIGTAITDIGERCALYTQNTSKVLSITKEGLNTVKETGAATDISTAAKFQSVSGMSKASDIEFYQNFARTGRYTCDQRLEFNVAFYSLTADNRFDDYGSMVDIAANDSEWVVESGTFTAGNDVSVWTRVSRNADGGYTLNYNGSTAYRFTKIIPAGKTISQVDMDVIEGIFAIADNVNNNTDVKYRITGDVYVGTKSTATADERDLSNNISFNTFLNDYVNDVTYDVSWDYSYNGQWVKFIDNDNDGRCDYAFKTNYVLDEVIGTYTNKAGDTVMDYNGFNDDASIENNTPVRYMDGIETIERNVAVGDVVLAAWIDGQRLVSHADSVTTKATSYNWKTEEVTTTDKTYGQSYIGNATDMLQLLSNMAAQTNYEMFLDKFGYVRAFRNPNGTQYALVTELYYNNNANGSLIKNWPMSAELTMPDENGKAVTKEYSTSSSNPFVAKFAWTFIANRTQLASLQNWLQPVVPNLGVSRVGYGPVIYSPNPANVSANYTGTYWPGWLQQTRTVNSLLNTNGQLSTEFNYGPQNYYDNAGNATVTTNVAASFTNVAVVSIDGESATLNGAAKLNLDTYGNVGAAGDPNSYAVNYIQLKHDKDVVKGAASFTIGGDAAYQRANNYTVNATNDTEIYIVHNGGVEYYKGYANMPKLTQKDNVIHAAYAVAKNTNLDTHGAPYWVADVIVYEVKTWNDLEKSSISLAYFTANQTLQSANGTIINTLNSKTDPAKVDLRFGLGWNDSGNWDYINNGDWLNSWKSYGFYHLYNDSAVTDGVMTAARIEKIDSKYNDNTIFAGVVAREVDLATNGGYLPINMTGAREADGTLKLEANVKVSLTTVYSVTNNVSGPVWFTEADNLYYSNIASSQVKAGDHVVWVGAGDKTAAVNNASFVVDLGNPNWYNQEALRWNYELNEKTPTWLKNIYSAIMNEQGQPEAAPNTRKVTIKTTGLPTNWEKEVDVLIGSSVTYNFTSANPLFDGTTVPAGYALNSVTPAAGGTDTVLGVVPTGSNSAYTLANVPAPTDGENTTITLNYTMTATSLTVTLADDGVATWTGTQVGHVIPSITPTYGNVASGVAISGITYDGDVTLNWTGAASTTYTLSGTDAASYEIDGTVGGAWTVTGKATGAQAITITANAVTYNVTAGENVAWSGSNNTNWSADLTGTISAANGYNIASGAMVVVVDTHTGVELYRTSYVPGTITIPATRCAGHDITINVTDVDLAVVDLTFDLQNGGQAWVTFNGTETEITNASAPTLKVRVNDTITIRTSSSVAGAPNVAVGSDTAASVGAISGIDNGAGYAWTCNVSNIYATTGSAAVITITLPAGAPAAPAEG